MKTGVLPEILVAGMPNSGTSFMTELVAKATGLSPGPARGLKGADGHNPHGYWEYLPLRNYIWQHTGGTFNERKVPSLPLPYKEAQAKWIASIAKAANVQVFKCFKLPWIYSWFGEPRKVVMISRRIYTLYERYYKPAGLEPNEYRAAHTQYYDLAARHLDEQWDMLWITYEEFCIHQREAMAKVCDFLGRPFKPELLEIWRPRC